MKSTMAVFIGFVLVAACAGQSEPGIAFESPARVTVGVDWIWSEPAGLHFARTETTVAQYQACMNDGGCDREHISSRLYFPDAPFLCVWGCTDCDDYPMTCISWYGAAEFCKWAGGRLPTADEWYAEASDGGEREFPWGNEAPDCSKCIRDDGGDGCGKDRPWPVCSKPPGNSVSGLCDMAGNVWEWTSSPRDGGRVGCGGSWQHEGVKTSTRPKLVAGSRTLGSVGFRCVRSTRP
jgi:formylglycine-generating enzyme required for sulfatase activity